MRKQSCQNEIFALKCQTHMSFYSTSCFCHYSDQWGAQCVDCSVYPAVLQAMELEQTCTVMSYSLVYVFTVFR